MSSLMIKAKKSVSSAPTIASDLERVLIGGDLSRFSEEQRLVYYKRVCETVGLNYLTKPFDYIVLNGKLTLYANKGCAEQLRSIHHISIKITARETIEGVYVVTADGKFPDGREDSSTGAVSITGLKGEVLANAFLKAETKAKRRVTLSMCGLNMLDETEVESIPEGNKMKSESAGPGYVKPEDPGEGNGITPDHGYRIPFGKYAKRALEDIATDDLKSYVNYLEAKAFKDGKEITGVVKEFIDRASDHIAALENGMFDDDARG